MALTVREVETAGPGRHGDGRGLYLLVKVSGSKSWVLRYQINGQRRDMGLGSYPTVGLAKARQRRHEAHQLISDGIDPLTHRKRQQSMTFREAAEALIESKRPGWKNAKHAAQWSSTLSTYAFPRLGGMDISALETGDILGVLKPIWSKKSETASRVRQRIEAVIDYGTALGIRSGDNPARWRGHLDHLLPKPSKVKAVRHHPALPHHQIAHFMSDLRAREGVGARALAFTILTAARSGETRGMKWTEIDLDNRLWTIPAERMKAGKEHRVPLSKAALALIGDFRGSNGLVFESETKRGKSISNMSMAAVLRRMQHDGITVHGFRSTFRDWAGETTGFPREVIEAALAHRLKDRAEAAYARSDLFEKRRKLMDAWASYAVKEGSDSKVIAFR